MTDAATWITFRDMVVRQRPGFQDGDKDGSQGAQLPFQVFLGWPDHDHRHGDPNVAPSPDADPFGAMEPRFSSAARHPASPDNVLHRSVPAQNADAFEQTGVFGHRRLNGPDTVLSTGEWINRKQGARSSSLGMSAGAQIETVVEALDMPVHDSAKSVATYPEPEAELSVRVVLDPAVRAARSSRAPHPLFAENLRADGMSAVEDAPIVQRTMTSSISQAVLASARSATSPVQVAVQATEAGLKVLARVERMSAEDRERLNREIGALVREFGFQAVEAVIHEHRQARSG